MPWKYNHPTIINVIYNYQSVNYSIRAVAKFNNLIFALAFLTNYYL